MFLRAPASLLVAQLFLSGVYLCEAVLAQQSASATPAVATQTAESHRLGETSSSLALDVSIQASESANAEVTAAVMLFTPASSELRASEQPHPNPTKTGSAMDSTKPVRRSGDSRWRPPNVDENVPPVEAGAACNLDEVLEKAGKRIQEFVGNVDRFTATESLVHEMLGRTGNVSQTVKRKYDYVVSIEEIRPGILDLQEYEGSGPAPADPPGGMTTRGLSALALIFHPYYSGTFAMKCEGLATMNGQRTWQIYFRQRQDKPNQIRAFRAGLNKSYPVDLKGRAWIVADSYQIVGLQTDLIGAIPDIRLNAEHTAIEYGPVHFGSRDLDMWLPQTAEVYMELRGKRHHRRISFNNYLLFAVDDKQQIAAPKTDP